MKRLFDILVSIVGLIVMSPLLVIIAIAIIMLDGPPVLFLHERVGRNGRLFYLVKFRTMTVLNTREKGGFDAGNRKRITPIGHFLRRTKLDELPQLWNVLAGEMSIVGPRPEVRKWTEVYPERWAVVHMVRPGITDTASIVFRNEEDILAALPDPEKAYRVDILPKKLKMYDEYVRSRSFVGDLKIIFRTLLALVKGKS